MKKFVLLILGVLLAISVVGCTGSDIKIDFPSQTPSPTTTPTPSPITNRTVTPTATPTVTPTPTPTPISIIGSWQELTTIANSSFVGMVNPIAVSGGNIYILHYKSSEGYMQLSKYNGATVTTLNTNYEAGGSALAFDSAGYPYILFKEVYGGMYASYSYSPTLIKFNGSTWDIVGARGFCAPQVYSPCIAIDNQTIYAGYEYEFYDGTPNRPVVKKYSDSLGWVTVGVAGFSDGGATDVRLVLDKNHVPYVSYIDSTCSGKATVKKFNGDTWETVGIKGFTPTVGQVSLCFDSQNTPYLAYSKSLDSTIGVMKYTGTSWVTEIATITAVGDNGDTFGFSGIGGFAIDSLDRLYLCSTDNYPHAFVVRYHNGVCETLGNLTAYLSSTNGIIPLVTNYLNSVCLALPELNGANIRIMKFSEN